MHHTHHPLPRRHQKPSTEPQLNAEIYLDISTKAEIHLNIFTTEFCEQRCWCQLCTPYKTTSNAPQKKTSPNLNYLGTKLFRSIMLLYPHELVVIHRENARSSIRAASRKLIYYSFSEPRKPGCHKNGWLWSIFHIRRWYPYPIPILTRPNYPTIFNHW